MIGVFDAILLTQDRHCTVGITVTMGRVRETIVAVD